MATKILSNFEIIENLKEIVRGELRKTQSEVDTIPDTVIVNWLEISPSKLSFMKSGKLRIDYELLRKKLTHDQFAFVMSGKKLILDQSKKIKPKHKKILELLERSPGMANTILNILEGNELRKRN